MGGRVKKSTTKRQSVMSLEQMSTLVPIQKQLDIMQEVIAVHSKEIGKLKHAEYERAAREPIPAPSMEGYRQTSHKTSTLAGHLRKAMGRMRGISISYVGNFINIYTYWYNKQHIKIHVTDKEYIMTYKMRNGVEQEERHDSMTQAAASATSCAMFYAMDKG